ncbi:hypothetical protein LTR62_000221 [Meristemomyces frigidus]|uniref:C3H1-type domain-containing protein n=1 Tax=Meristemomyces frigidus TaxID=1508187 RepID=A0AAN7TJ93_9PEZI|nr:hypothetical protein LTR62_000221 [Meristemomyces frigidus]
MPSRVGNGTAASDSISHVRSFWARHEILKDNDTLKNVLLEDVITRYESLVNKHAEYVTQHQQERELAQASLLREQQAVVNFQHLQNLLNRDPYVLVLVDGDGVIFNSKYLREAENGGKQAATALYNAVHEWSVANVLDCPPDTRVIVRIYLNLKGLADACVKGGVLPVPNLLEDFGRGFSRGNILFDFVDVGTGKDQAYIKVAENFKLFLSDYHCRQLLLGCSQNPEYSRLLEQFSDNREALQRVTLLEGVPFEKDLAILPFPTTRFAGIFRETKLVLSPPDLLTGYVDLRRDSRTLSGASDAFTPRSGTPVTRYGTPSYINESPAHLRTVSTTSSNSDNINTWAGKVKASAALPFMDKTSASPVSSALTGSSDIPRNRAGQRIDETLEYDREEVQRLKRLKMCNQHFIGLGCCHFNAGKAEKCPHRHDMKLNKHELHCLRIVARETPCKRGLFCDDVKCIYGHRCPFPTASEGSMRGSGRCMNGEACRFNAEMHGVDTRIVKFVKVI